MALVACFRFIQSLRERFNRGPSPREGRRCRRRMRGSPAAGFASVRLLRDLRETQSNNQPHQADVTASG